jgi:hypothetical protein
MEVIEGKKTHLRLVSDWGLTGLQQLRRQCCACPKRVPLVQEPAAITFTGNLLLACEDCWEYVTGGDA